MKGRRRFVAFVDPSNPEVCMSLLPSADWAAAKAIAGIGYCNPFLPERVELERRALGRGYVPVGPVIRARPGTPVGELFPNVPTLHQRAYDLVEAACNRLTDGAPATPAEMVVYEDLALYALYGRYMSSLDGLVTRSTDTAGRDRPVPFWREFEADFGRLLRLPGRDLPSQHDPAVVFAGFYQIERAFTHVFRQIVGGSMPAARLRAAAWQSVFTHDMRRYVRALHRSMSDIPTLVVGPSGSGKELVARAIGLSGYIPFDPGSRRFVTGGSELFVPLNLSALAPTLIESELFGHKKGAFTGALADRDGWLKGRSECGAVFLDEIGELDGAIQVKLLRVLESRRFHRLGDTETLEFKGKIIAATNRDLGAEMHAGRFRHDLYYRLCADQVVTPSLAEQLADRPEDLAELVRFIAQDVLAGRAGTQDGAHPGPADDHASRGEAERLAAEVVAWIERDLGRDYAWPGNFRELGQCVRNVMIRGTYRPPSAPGAGSGASGPVEAFLEQVREVGVTAKELLGRYYALAYDRSEGSYTSAGRRLGVDWRVIKRHLDPTFLERIRRPRTTGAG
jgi:DNA-binding NtrC family response regulator